MKRLTTTLIVLGMATMGRAEVPREAHVAAGNNRFALDLFHKVKDEPGNLFVSPYSISSALAMTYGGARGETAEEMARVLHFSEPPARLHPAFAAIRKSLAAQGANRGIRLNVANRLWGQQSFTFESDFLRLTRESYGAELATLDFEHQTEQARKTINAWVEEQTQDRIKNLIHPDDLNSDTRLVLTNAIYFKAIWSKPFEKSATTEENFRLSTGKDVRVPTMHRTSRIEFWQGDGLKSVSLPYGRGELSMTILLPDKTDGLAELEANLTPETLSKWVGETVPTEVNVSLPRFRMTSRVKLGQVLKAMGMKQAFTMGEADFSGMSRDADLSLSEVIHQAFVEVNEEGTEAAAATAVVSRAPSPLPPPPVEFRADHPFLFMIRDRATGSILFLGRVMDPR